MLHLLQENIDITHLSNYKTPSQALYLYEIKDKNWLSQLSKVYDFAITNKLPVLIVSSWTNMLFAFDIYEGIVVHNRLSWWSYDVETKMLTTYGAESIWEIAEVLEQKYNQDIWHRFIWLPWSIAWAIYGNAWCFWLETSSNFSSCDVYNMKTWVHNTLSSEDMNFGYRYSVLKERDELYLVSAVFDLSHVVEKYNSNVDNIHFREHMQPKWNSCWSFFKNPKIDREDFLRSNPELSKICPKNISAWFLLEQVWLKGFSYWGAYFSDIHTNFLMHNWQWKWTDMLHLIQLAEQKVWESFWVRIENEVKIIYSN